ncbi:hypothetical protein N7451_012222 [Penicillium sp. IBT 35674x]|nr:hypothetical protein N7451_012222 [Penicillium sp. IBT 35674x]
MLQALQEQSRNADIESTGSESPEPSVEIQMCDAGEKADPVLHNETIIDKDIGDHCRNRQASITLMSLDTSTENNLKEPLKLVSAWSAFFIKKKAIAQLLEYQRPFELYVAKYHRGRSSSSIAGRARCLGLSVGRKSSKKPTRTVRRVPLVLNVRVSPIDKLSSSEEVTSAGSVQSPTGTCVGEETPNASSAPSHSLQDYPGSPVEFHTTSLCVSSDSLFILQPSAKRNYPNLRQSDPELPVTFGFILG